MADPAESPRTSDDSASFLAGRERERALLRERLAAALAGRGGLVLIGGEAGIGKTALTMDLGREADERGALILAGHCYDLTDTPPYGPWTELFDRCPELPDLPPQPIIGAEDGVASGTGNQALLFGRVRAFLTAVAAQSPLVLLLDDLHWADAASLELLRYVARHAGTIPILLAVTYRADELSRRHPLFGLLPILIREAPTLRLDLRRLGDEAVGTLVAARYCLPPAAAARLVRYLQTRAEGNPFFIGELLRTLEEQGLLRVSELGWALGELARVRVPPFLRQVIEGRLDRLGDEARELLAVAAVIGQEVPLALWGGVGAAEEGQLLEVVERGVETHLLEETPDGTGMRFVHALIRAALYEGLLPPRRQVWHRRIGEALVALPSPDPDTVAYHFRQAGDARAVGWLLRAAARAERTYAWLTAAERLNGAAQLLQATDRARERGWVLVHLAWLRRYADPQRSVASLTEALAVAADLDDPVLAACAAYFCGIFRCYAGEIRRGLADLASALAALTALTPAARERHRPLDQLGLIFERSMTIRGTYLFVLALAGRYRDAEAVWAQEPGGEAAAPPSHYPGVSPLADGYFGSGIMHAGLGRPDDARRYFALARDTYRAVEHYFLLGLAAATELNEVLLPYQTERRTERHLLTTEAEEAWARASGAWEAFPPALARLAVQLIEGHWDEVRQVALEASASGGIVGRQFLAVSVLAPLARWQGDNDLAWAQIRAVLREGPDTPPGDTWLLPALALQRVAVSLALDEGNPSDARDWLDAHDRWLAWSGALSGRAEGMLAWAEYHRAAHKPDLASASAIRALTLASEPRQPLALLAAYRLLGQLDGEAGRYPEARAHLQAALELAVACGAAYEQALTRLAFAELLLTMGDGPAAQVSLSEARETCARLGAHPALARADALAERLSGATSATATNPAGLTTREVEVLRLIAVGLTNAEAAERLYLSPRTIEQHMRSIYNKLGGSSRSAATRFAMEHNLA